MVFSADEELDQNIVRSALALPAFAQYRHSPAVLQLVLSPCDMSAQLLCLLACVSACVRCLLRCNCAGVFEKGIVFFDNWR